MHLVFSVPSGFHARELLLPLKALLEADTAIEHITLLTPAAAHRSTVFSAYGPKFSCERNPATIEEHEQLLKRLVPSVVITTTSGLELKDVPILDAARRLKIPTFTFIASWDNVYKMERVKNDGRQQIIADRVAVWNTMMRDHLLRIFPDTAPATIFTAGVPRLDFFTHTDKIPSREQLFSTLGLADLTMPLVHLATTELYPADYLVRTLATQPVQLFVSVHPGGNLERHRRYSEPHGAKVGYSFGRQNNASHPAFRYNPTADDVYMHVALFKHSNVLVTQSSTVAIESLRADRPFITVKYGKHFDWWRWYRSMVYRDFYQHYRDITDGEATQIVRNAKELIAALQDYLAHPEKQQAERAAILKKMITVTDGTAGEQVLNLIKGLIQ